MHACRRSRSIRCASRCLPRCRWRQWSGAQRWWCTAACSGGRRRGQPSVAQAARRSPRSASATLPCACPGPLPASALSRSGSPQAVLSVPDRLTQESHGCVRLANIWRTLMCQLKSFLLPCLLLGTLWGACMLSHPESIEGVDVGSEGCGQGGSGPKRRRVLCGGSRRALERPCG